MTTIDTAALRKLAEAATPGPWHYRPDPYDDWGWVRGPRRPEYTNGLLAPAVARAGRGHFYSEADKTDDEHRAAGTDPYEPNAAYIAAANPAAVLALLDRLEAAEADNGRLRAALMPFADMASEVSDVPCSAATPSPY